MGLSPAISDVLISGELQTEVADVLILRELLIAARSARGSGDDAIGGTDGFTDMRDGGGGAALRCCDGDADS